MLIRTDTQKKLRIVSEKVVSRANPDVVVGDRPEDFPQLTNSCKVIAAMIETGKDYKLISGSN